MAERRVDVAVIGGGVAGLSAAWTLHKQGVSFALLEAGPRWGGLIRTEHERGFLLEAGPDTILTQKPEGVGLCQELGLADRLISTNPQARTVYMLRRGRLHPLPEGMLLGIPTRVLVLAKSRLFSWPAKLRMLLDLVIPAASTGTDESIARFIQRRLGAEAVERLAEPLLAGIHAGDPNRLSLRSTFPRLADLEARHGSLIRGMWKERRSTHPAAWASPFVSLAGGLQELVEALVARLPADRRWELTPARCLARESGRLVVGLDHGVRLQARSVIVAVPAAAAAPLLTGVAPEAAEALAGIRFASTATVLLGYRREAVGHPLDGYGLVVPRSEGLRTSACSFFSTKFPGRAPQGCVLLRAFVGGSRDPGVLDLEDRALVDSVHREIAGVLRIRDEPLLSRLYRWPAATPQMEVGHGERIAVAERSLSKVPGLFLTGAGIRGVGIPDTVGDASRAAASAARFVLGTGVSVGGSRTAPGMA